MAMSRAAALLVGSALWAQPGAGSAAVGAGNVTAASGTPGADGGPPGGVPPGRQWVEQCPGSFDVPGHGEVSLVATQWNVPGMRAGPVDFVGGAVMPGMFGRTYFGDSCAYAPEAYSNFELLGKKLTYTTDVSGAGCGCNAAMYLVSMRHNDMLSGCEDYYCDANSVCGPNCHEIDIQEANRFAWHSTLHKAWDGSGVSAGYGGWVHNNNQFDFGPESYGPEATCIDTDLPFEVSVSFPTGPDGKLTKMEIGLAQNGCEIGFHIAEYNADPGFDILTDALKAGMTPVVSYWKSPDMLWLDGPGVGGGPCQADTMQCVTPPKFAGFRVESL